MKNNNRSTVRRLVSAEVLLRELDIAEAAWSEDYEINPAGHPGREALEDNLRRVAMNARAHLWGKADLSLQARRGAEIAQAAEIKKLQTSVVTGFYGDEFASYTQGMPNHELQEIATAKECNALVKAIKKLRKDVSTRDNEIASQAAEIACLWAERDAAWREGAEAMRDAVRVSILHWPVEAPAAKEAALVSHALRALVALPIPERKP